jgi:hypothetical protein
MHYDEATGAVTGIAPSNAPPEMRIIVTAPDSAGQVTHREVIVDFSSRDTPRTHQPPARQPPAHRSVPPQTALPAAKPSLAEQFARQRNALHVSRLVPTVRPSQIV